MCLGSEQIDQLVKPQREARQERQCSGGIQGDKEGCGPEWAAKIAE